MTEIDMAKAVRSWLRGLPGTVDGNDSAECLRGAWASFGHGNIEMFRVALEREGFIVEPLGAKFILRLPPKPVEGPNNFNRLRNIRSRLDDLR